MAYTLTWDHGVTADSVIDWEIDQNENDFATLSITVKNPRTGILSGNLWATLTRNATTIFYGRLVGVPEDLQSNSVQLLFLARPDTYDTDKAALAETLKVAPYWDPVWVPPERLEEPDAVLEARPQYWHTDRVTHTVTVSDIIEGEAGTTVIDPDTVPYDSVKIRPGETPAELITCNAEVQWRQAASGNFDLTARLMEAADDAGTVDNGYITSYTGSGLLSSWPKIGHSIGGGWEVGDSTAERIEEFTSVLAVTVATGGFKSNTGLNPDGSNASTFIGGWDVVVVDEEGNPIPAGATIYDDGDGGYTVQSTQTYTSTYGIEKRYTPLFPNQYKVDPDERGGPSIAGFVRWSLNVTFGVKFDIERERSELITFTIAAGVQSLVSARQDAQLSVELSTSQVDQPIDPGGATPIGSVTRSTYILTDRGKESLEYLITLCRARLLQRARAVEVAFTTTLTAGLLLSLRHSATLVDPRLPGGTATGKVTSLNLSFDSMSGVAKADVVISCTIGTGGSLSVTSPTGDYVDDTYVVARYQAVTGGATGVAGDISYVPIDTTTPIAGPDFANLTEDDIVTSLTVTGGQGDQTSLLLGSTWQDTGEATAALEELPTHFDLVLVPVAGDTLQTIFDVTVDDLIVPKTIDLSA